MLNQALNLIGNHPSFVESLETARNIAVTKTPVLIYGEPGSGKKATAAYIHSNSSRKSSNLEIVDCAQEGKTVEGRILGYRDEESGKFNRGALEVANGGTVIFANIDALDENLQKRLYTIIQELPDYEIDVRIIATTSKNISKLVGAGKFLRVLYNYFSGAQIELLPLRERGSDMESLASHFVSTLCEQNGMESLTITPEAMQKLYDYSWTQNINELKKFMFNAIENANTNLIDIACLESGEKKTDLLGAEFDDDGVKLMSLKEAEKLLIKKALIYTSENRTQAAKILGVSIRTLRNKINEYRSEGTGYFINLR